MNPHFKLSHHKDSMRKVSFNELFTKFVGCSVRLRYYLGVRLSLVLIALVRSQVPELLDRDITIYNYSAIVS